MLVSLLTPEYLFLVAQGRQGVCDPIRQFHEGTFSGYCYKQFWEHGHGFPELLKKVWPVLQPNVWEGDCGVARDVHKYNWFRALARVTHTFSFGIGGNTVSPCSVLTRSRTIQQMAHTVIIFWRLPVGLMTFLMSQIRKNTPCRYPPHASVCGNTIIPVPPRDKVSRAFPLVSD